jgi:hypothetical protein
MSTFVYEASNSPDIRRKGSKGSSATLTYNVIVDAGEGAQEAVDAAVEFSPLIVHTPETDLIRTEGQPKVLVPLNSDGYGSYEVSISYSEDDEEKSQERPEPGTWHYSLDSGNTSVRIYQSLGQISYGGPDGTSTGPNYGNVLGWDGKEAKGVDDSAPAPEFQITAYFEPKQVTTEFFSDLCEKAYRTNQNAWCGFPAGTLMYQGMSGQGDIPTVAGQRIKPVPLVFKFGYSKNLTNIDLGDGIIVPSKKGWQYLDVQYQTVDDGTFTKPKVKRWSVHRMKPEMDFKTELGFGT